VRFPAVASARAKLGVYRNGACQKLTHLGNSAARATQPQSGSAPSTNATAEIEKRRARNVARQQKAAERIAAATSELASGIAEGSAASEELRRAMDPRIQIAAGAASNATRKVSGSAFLIARRGAEKPKRIAIVARQRPNVWIGRAVRSLT